MLWAVKHPDSRAKGNPLPTQLEMVAGRSRENVT